MVFISLSERKGLLFPSGEFSFAAQHYVLMYVGYITVDENTSPRLVMSSFFCSLETKGFTQGRRIQSWNDKSTSAYKLKVNVSAKNYLFCGVQSQVLSLKIII